MCEVAVHEVLFDQAAGYARHEEWCSVGTPSDLGTAACGSPSMAPRRSWNGYQAGRHTPRDRGSARLFSLASGQVGRYRANFRFTFTECACNPSWFYEEWVVQVGNGLVGPDGLIHGEPDHHVDHRVHLYGGTIRPARGSHHR
jgi:hypothetical protein